MTKALEIEEGAAPEAEKVESPLAIKQDYKLNEAQSVLMAIGIRPELIFAHYKERTYSYTKKGPGRAHKQGKELESV